MRMRADIAFSDDRSTRFLPAIVALMVFLAALAAAAALGVGNARARWDATLAGRLTVQVPRSAATAAQTARALVIVRATPGVAAAAAVDDEAALALLEPWLGRLAAATELPVPALIDVTLAPGARIDAQALAARLGAEIAGAAVDDHRVWLRPLIELARTVELVALAVLALIAASAVATVVFAVRSGLAVHAPVIELLHNIGARDAYVADQFARHALRTGAAGAVVGAVAAAAVLALLARGGSAVDPTLLPPLALDTGGWLVLLAVPFAAVAIAVVTAHVTVLRALGRLP